MTSLMALDQSAAFDCISHPLLLKKLELYKCSKNTLVWMDNYLSLRSQFVQVGRHKSNIRSLNRGVPQGSILGPLLFLIFTNEIPETMISQNCNNTSHLNNQKLFSQNCNNCGLIVAFADDLTIVISDKNRTHETSSD